MLYNNVFNREQSRSGFLFVEGYLLNSTRTPEESPQTGGSSGADGPLIQSFYKQNAPNGAKYAIAIRMPYVVQKN